MTSSSSSPSSSHPPDVVDDGDGAGETSTVPEVPEQPTPSASKSPVEEATPPVPSAGPWQAIFSPQYNTYYFYNSVTQETTWINPLQPDSASSGEPSSSTSTAHDDNGASPQPEAGPSTSLSSSNTALQA